MDMRDYEYNVRHRGDDLRREMEHHRLVESLTETRPSLFGRLRNLFRRAAETSVAQTEYMPRPAARPVVNSTVVAASTAKVCHPEHA
jgi:hypothetical protein